MSADAPAGKPEYTERIFSLPEASAIGRVEANRLRAWIARDQLPGLGQKHPKLGAWLFSTADLLRIRVAGEVADLTGDIGLANAMSLRAVLWLGLPLDEQVDPGAGEIAGRDPDTGYRFLRVPPNGQIPQDRRAIANAIRRGAHVSVPVDVILRDVLAEAKELLADA